MRGLSRAARFPSRRAEKYRSSLPKEKVQQRKRELEKGAPIFERSAHLFMFGCILPGNQAYSITACTRRDKNDCNGSG